MDSLVLIGVIILVTVVTVDCFIRIIIVCKTRKRKRAVKPLDTTGQPPLPTNNTNIARREDNDDNDTDAASTV